MTTLILLFIMPVLVSFTCSLVEAVILSLSHAQVTLLMNQGHYTGRLLKKFKDKIDRPLAAILTLNTIANTIGAAAVGAQALAMFGSQAVAFVSALLTLCILVISEIIPKTLGGVYSKELAPLSAIIIQVLIIVTYPVVLVFNALSRAIAGRRRSVRVTREEVMVAADMGQAEGQLQAQEQSIIRNLLHLNNVHIRDVMTPRSVLFALPQDETVDQAVKNHVPIRFSRIPIFGKDLDDIIGLVRRYQINQAYAQGLREWKLSQLASPIHPVPETKSVASTLDEFIKRRDHLFLVVDEYGGTAGIITLEDVIETLLGVEIVDELDSVADLRKLASEQWEKRKKARETLYETIETRHDDKS
ncbi:MAG: DUF21 domain-containing protein [Deltaproteobacteria bacterium]|nr:DUF21 domain-containing protein [Deltaproteobacteria bacterium]